MKQGPPKQVDPYPGYHSHPWMRKLAEQAIKSQNEALCFYFTTMQKTPMTRNPSTIPSTGSPRSKYGAS